MTTKSEEQIAKEFVIWGTIPDGYATRSETDEAGDPILELGRTRQTDKGPIWEIVATRIKEA